MDPMALLVLAVAAGLVGALLWRRRGSADEDGAGRADALDTLAGWPPEVTRVLTLQERRAYNLLTHALPDHMVLAQVPVSRFIRVPTRNSYHEWMRRVGQLCADLVICDNASQVIAVVEVRRPAGKDSDRTRRRHDRMDRVLRKAGVRVIEWNEESLPHRDSVREQVLPTPRSLGGAEAGATVSTPRPLPYPGGRTMTPPPRAAAAAAGAVTPATMASAAASRAASAKAPPGVASLDEVLEEIERSGQRDGFSPTEPTPSTWFDELDSERMPLDQHKG